MSAHSNQSTKELGLRIASNVLIALAVATSGGLAFGQKDEILRSQELLSSNPDVIQARLQPITSKRPENVHQTTNITPRFKVGDKIKFDLIMTNTTLAPIRILVGDPFVYNRLHLYGNGQLLTYRAEIEELIPKIDEQTDFMRTDSILLEPNSSKPVEVISLADWYDQLKPGHYELTAQHRFQIGGKWIDSSSITFEIQTTKR